METRKLKFAILSFFIVLLFGCKEHKLGIKPPFADLDPAFQIFSVDADKGFEYKTETGTEIKIPANAFSDENGSIVKGIVEVRYREFHHISSIMLSGLNLNYKDNNLATGGMFEIRAFQNSKPLKVALNKNISVNLAVFKIEDKYKYWIFNDTTMDWKSVSDGKYTVNLEKIKLTDSIKKIIPLISIPVDKSMFCFNFAGVLDFYSDYFKQYDGNAVKQKIKDYGLQYLGISRIDEEIVYNKKRYPASYMLWKKISENNFPKKADDYGIEKLIFKGNNLYTLKLRNYTSQKILYYEVEAIMPLRMFFGFKPEEWKTKYDETMNKMTTELTKLNLMCDAYQQFYVKQFGVYNCDYEMKYDNKALITAVFKFDKSIDEKFSKAQIFYVMRNNEGFFNFVHSQENELTLVDDSTAKFVALLPDRTIAVYERERYRKLDITKLKSKPKQKIVFDLHSIITLNTEQDLKDILTKY